MYKKNLHGTLLTLLNFILMIFGIKDKLIILIHNVFFSIAFCILPVQHKIAFVFQGHIFKHDLYC